MREGIKTNRNLFVTVKLNPKFNFIRPHVDSLLDKMYQEKRKDAESKISRIEQDIQKTKFWFESKYASSEDVRIYNSICEKLLEAKAKLQTQSYFGYDEALITASEIDTLLKQVYPKKSTINSLEERHTLLANEIANEVKKEADKKFKIIGNILSNFVILALALVLLYDWLGNNHPVFILLSIVLGGALIAVVLGGFLRALCHKPGYTTMAIRKLTNEKRFIEEIIQKLKSIS